MGNVTTASTTSGTDLGVVSGTSGRRRHGGAGVLGAFFVAVVGMVVWWVTRTTWGDPGGRILAQIAPAASALPGYGTADLPWKASPSTTGSYLIESEPHKTSCDGRVGTLGWSSVVVQGRFSFAGTRMQLLREMTPRLAALGWSRVPHVHSTDT